MLGKTEKNPQLNLGEIPLIHYISADHELCRLARKINWDEVEKDFSGYYSKKGAPSVPVRTMIGLILLKHVYRFSDKSAVDHWLENPYWQHFCGEVYLQHKAPFYYGDISHFRKRIGKDGEEKMARLGASVFGQSFLKGFHLFHKKDKRTGKMGVFSGLLNRLGHYLVKATAH
jgi:IS5 family transposase